MNYVIGVLPLIMGFVLAVALPLLSGRIVERVLVNSEGWQQKDARTRRQLSRFPGVVVVVLVVAVYIVTNQHWL